MTDTTDIKALRESAESMVNLLENLAGYEPQDIDMDAVELRFEGENGFDTGCDISIVDTAKQSADIIRALLDQLEAERQRADAVCRDIRIQANDLKSAQTVNKVLQAELAALKGDRVPVAWILERVITKPGHEGKVWRSIHYPDRPEAKAIDGVYRDVIVPLYDRPQNPVVLPQATVHSFSGEGFYTREQMEAAIEAAGGVVKVGD